MTTPYKEFLAQQRAVKENMAQAKASALLANEAKKYPNGRFTIVRADPNDYWWSGARPYLLREGYGAYAHKSWRSSQPVATSYVSFRYGVGYDDHMSGGRERIWTRASSPSVINYSPKSACGHGQRYTYYSTLDKLLRACKKFDIPQELVDLFVNTYNERESVADSI